MHTGNEKNNRTSRARRVAVAEGVPQKCSHFWGRTATDRTPAVEPIRGYIKISDAAKAFHFDFRGKTVLDIGSSTGGFTKFALEKGAKKVIAVEKGTKQMMEPLRFDSRVELHEKTDIFDFKLTSKIDVVIADISFLSLKPVLEYLKTLSNAEFLVMLKPQFEAEPNQLNRGVVKNETIRRNIIKNFELWLKQNNFVVIKKRDNSLAGKTGNIERFYWLTMN